MTIVDALRIRLGHALSNARAEMSAKTLLDPRFPNKRLRCYETQLGTYYLPADAKRDWVADRMRRGQVFEPEVVELARRFIVPGTTVLDVGSNFGQMALLFAQMVGDEGRVLAFEADDFVFSVLKRNILANQARNVELHLGAVHERSGEKAFYPVQDFKRFGTYGSYGIDPMATSGRSIQTIRIDDLELPGRVSFMKVDVQGCDLFAMRGAVATIARHRMPILFEYEEGLQPEFQTSFQQYVDFVTQIGYRFERTVYGINYLIVPRGESP